MVAANLNGPFYAIHSFLPKLKAARGTVVIISSVSGAYTDRSGPAYQAAKAARSSSATAPASRAAATSASR